MYSCLFIQEISTLDYLFIPSCICLNPSMELTFFIFTRNTLAFFRLLSLHTALLKIVFDSFAFFQHIVLSFTTRVLSRDKNQKRLEPTMSPEGQFCTLMPVKTDPSSGQKLIPRILFPFPQHLTLGSFVTRLKVKSITLQFAPLNTYKATKAASQRI